MDTINKEPISVDFGNADQDGAIRLITNGTTADIKRMELKLTEGERIWMTDGEIEATGTLSTRDGMWVATIDGDGFNKVA